LPVEQTARSGTFNTTSVAIITFLFTGCLALVIALAGAAKPTSYDKDQAFIKAAIQQDTQNIHELTTSVSALSVSLASVQSQVQELRDARTTKPR
jgi:allophanate hydrolase subunit 1